MDRMRAGCCTCWLGACNGCPGACKSCPEAIREGLPGGPGTGCPGNPGCSMRMEGVIGVATGLVGLTGLTGLIGVPGGTKALGPAETTAEPGAAPTMLLGDTARLLGVEYGGCRKTFPGVL